jgi:hypothetical protein
MERTVFAFILLAIAVMVSASAETSSPFNVGSKTQLFIDQVLVRSADNVAFNGLPAGEKRVAVDGGGSVGLMW